MLTRKLGAAWSAVAVLVSIAAGLSAIHPEAKAAAGHGGRDMRSRHAGIQSVSWTRNVRRHAARGVRSKRYRVILWRPTMKEVTKNGVGYTGVNRFGRW